MTNSRTDLNEYAVVNNFMQAGSRDTALVAVDRAGPDRMSRPRSSAGRLGTFRPAGGTPIGQPNATRRETNPSTCGKAENAIQGAIQDNDSNGKASVKFDIGASVATSTDGRDPG